MSAHCPKDGGFIGPAGCTHPHHVHSPLVQKILAAKVPSNLKADEARRALSEGFYVDSPTGNRVGFGKNLLNHLTVHSDHDAEARLSRLLFAIDTVRNPDSVQRNHHLIKGRTAYAKAFADFGSLVISERNSDNIEYAFTFVPSRKNRKRG